VRVLLAATAYREHNNSRQIIDHNGGAPGVSTDITIALSDGIGVIALANADDKNSLLEEIILAVGRKAFNDPPSSDSPSDEQPTASPTRGNITSALSPLGLEGRYFNAGYGLSVLCSVLSSSPSCQSVLADFRSVDESLSSNSTDLFASWNGVWATHIRFTHTNDSQYLVSIGTIYPHGYGKNTTSFSTLVPGASAEFVVENKTVVGFGVSGLDGIQREGPVEEASDVWFVKVA
jgi:hypothetical protein